MQSRGANYHQISHHWCFQSWPPRATNSTMLHHESTPYLEMNLILYATIFIFSSLSVWRIIEYSCRVSFVWNCFWPWLGWSRRTLLFAVHSCFRSTSVLRNKILITSNKYWMIIYKIIIITKCSSNRHGSSEFWPQFLAFVYINQSIN